MTTINYVINLNKKNGEVTLVWSGLQKTAGVGPGDDGEVFDITAWDILQASIKVVKTGADAGVGVLAAWFVSDQETPVFLASAGFNVTNSSPLFLLTVPALRAMTFIKPELGQVASSNIGITDSEFKLWLKRKP